MRSNFTEKVKRIRTPEGTESTITTGDDTIVISNASTGKTTFRAPEKPTLRAPGARPIIWD